MVAWPSPVVSCTFTWKGIDELADATHRRDLAHLGHRRQAAGELAHHLVLVPEQLGAVDLRFAEADAEVGEVLDLVDHRGDVQQRLRRDAADVEADAAQRRVALDQDHLEAEVGGAEGGRIAAGAGAEHQQVAVEVDRTGVARCGGRRGAAAAGAGFGADARACGRGCCRRCRCRRRGGAFGRLQRQHHRALP